MTPLTRHQKIFACVPSIGLDGCKAGWFLVMIHPDGTWRSEILQSLNGLGSFLTSDTHCLIDIPIGLPDSGKAERACDTGARRMLGRRSSTVFPAPSRPALVAETYREACEINQKLTGRKLSKQSYHLFGKIAEADRFRRSFPDVRLREFHPEVGFWSLNGGQVVPEKKKSVEGQLKRLAILQQIYDQAGILYQDCLSRYLRRDVQRDDILDAMCGAILGRIPDRLQPIPEKPESDGLGLPMEIVYIKR